MVRVLLVDDHPVVRAGLKALLETTEHVEVVGEASSGEEAVEKARTLEPDIVIMDLAMPGMDGVQATRRIAELGLGAKILVVTIHDEDEYLVPALNAGAAGFLNKSAAHTDLIGAIEAISHGHSYLPQHAAALLARRKAQRAQGREAGPNVLSARELAAVELYASGLSASETGKEMGLSPKTVESYLARAKAKLGLHTRREIVRFALEAGLLRTEGDH
ncbi:response regulator [Candidatus Palauibacter sp.]|uniref:response regulator n=1 Tax=Candidatus Palauibacter sp. TaxID=3101350 RepID=UPI003C702627